MNDNNQADIDSRLIAKKFPGKIDRLDNITMFLKSDEDPKDIIPGFDLPGCQNILLYPGTPVEIVVFGGIGPDSLFHTSDLYGIRFVDTSRAKPINKSPVYYDIFRDDLNLLRNMSAGPTELENARKLLYNE
jgi:hypothetical protein